LTVTASPPLILRQPASLSAAAGTDAGLSIWVVGSSPLTYQWWLNSTNIINGATNSSIFLTNIQSAVAGKYSVAISNALGGTVSSNATLTVQASIPVILQQPLTQTVFPGANVLFSVVAIGSAPLRYQWRLGATNIPLATNTTLALSNVQAFSAGQYRVIITNSFRSVTSVVASLTLAAPPTLVSSPQNRLAILGGVTALSVSAIGLSPLSYQWLRNESLVFGATNSSLVMSNLQYADAGSYRVIVSNFFGSVTSSPPAVLSILSATNMPQWGGRQGDGGNTGRARYAIPSGRMGSNFFGTLLWQKQTPGSPNDGGIGAAQMVFFDGVGPGGTDILVGSYHWPKGVQGMDRHTGMLFWSGNPEGGESIGDNTPAFSIDGDQLYVINDATAHPLMAFRTSVGPSTYWHNGVDPDPNRLGAMSPKVSPDGRIFAHGYNDRPYAGTDDGANITVAWSAASGLCEVYSIPALSIFSNNLQVVAAGRCGDVKAFDGLTGEELWSVNAGFSTDADPTIDPATGNIYVPVGIGSVAVVGVSRNGTPLWQSIAMPVFSYQSGFNNQQWARSAGCLAHDGNTFYFQTVSQEGDGQLYAIDTSNGAVKWHYPTGSKAWETQVSSPIVTSNRVIIVGNNEGGAYYALRDDSTNVTLIAVLTMAPTGEARSTATLSPDGLLYLPARLAWIKSNGDGELPSQQAENLFNAFDLSASNGAMKISASALGSQCVLEWIGPHMLQSATEPMGPYLDVPSASSPFTNSIGPEPSRFFRLRSQ
jgi:outer membrane protein assembly factor BamB